jgi:uncharacterized protein with PQ loop repeat
MKNEVFVMYIATVFNFAYFIPQFYSLTKTKNSNFYDILPFSLALVYESLMLYYAILIDDDELFINCACSFVFTFIEVLLITYYAYYNGFSNIPHESFRQRTGTPTTTNDDPNPEVRTGIALRAF